VYEGNSSCGISSIDISTGEFSCTEVPFDRVVDELARIHPTEILLPETTESDLKEKISIFYDPAFTEYETWRYEFPEAEDLLKKTFLMFSPSKDLVFSGKKYCGMRVSSNSIIYKRSERRRTFPYQHTQLLFRRAVHAG